MPDRITQSQVNQTAWAACDTFRGVVDAGQYKDYILVMLFLKYISDLWNDHVAAYRQRFGDDAARIRRRLERERFVLPVGASFYDLHEQRHEANIGERINIALEAIEDANRAKLDGVFRNIDFNAEANLGRTKDRNRRLKNLLEDFAKPALRLAPVPRQWGYYRRVLHLPHIPLRLRCRQEGRRVLHPRGGLPAAGQAGGAAARRHHLRPGLRLRLAAHPRRRGSRLRQLRPSTARK